MRQPLTSKNGTPRDAEEQAGTTLSDLIMLRSLVQV